MNQQEYRNLISGKSVGVTAAPLRLFMGIAAAGYSLIVGLRNLLYSRQLLKIHTAGVPLISVGNITTGGTGKTPLVIWLCKFLQNENVPCAILTRGYKTRGISDEPAILAESCPQAKVIINPDRVAAAHLAVGADAKAMIMDDGFQHRRLARNLDIVTIDATCPFGYGKLLPAGLLREPLSSLRRADIAVLTRCDQVSESKLCQIEKELQLINPDMATARSIHNPIFAKYITGEKTAIEQLRSRKIFAFCGIGNPDAFLKTIRSIGANLVGSKIYDDHYHYTDNVIDDIYNQANHLEADLILTTQKDRTKIAPLTPIKRDIPLAYLAVEIKFTSGEDKLKQLIEDTLAGKIRKKC